MATLIISLNLAPCSSVVDVCKQNEVHATNSLRWVLQLLLSATCDATQPRRFGNLRVLQVFWHLLTTLGPRFMPPKLSTRTSERPSTFHARASLPLPSRNLRGPQRRRDLVARPTAISPKRQPGMNVRHFPYCSSIQTLYKLLYCRPLLLSFTLSHRAVGVQFDTRTITAQKSQ